MYSTSNNVIIAGVISDKPASALNGAISAAQTGNVNVDDSSNWPNNAVVKIDNELILTGTKPNTTSISITTRGYNKYNSSLP